MPDQPRDSGQPECRISIADSAPVLIWCCNSDGRCDWFNLRWLEFTGDTLTAAIEGDRYRAIHEEDRDEVRSAFEMAFAMRDAIELQYRMQAADGSIRWIHDRAAPRFEGDDIFAGYVGVCTDITHQFEQRARMQEREAVMRRLQKLSESEHAFLSAGIHDGLLQDIIGCDMLLQGASQLDAERLSKRIDRARQSLRSAIKHGRRLISELRPMILDEQGLLSAIEFYAAEIENRSEMRVTVERAQTGEIRHPVWDLNMFRIVQEAMNNAESHSRSEWMAIRVSVESDVLRIVVKDGGEGFEKEKYAESFGIRCMNERAALFNGSVEILTSPGGGSTVLVEMPLPRT